MKRLFMKSMQYALMYLSSKAFNLSKTWTECHRLHTMEDVISHCEKCVISIHMHAIWNGYVPLSSKTFNLSVTWMEYHRSTDYIPWKMFYLIVKNVQFQFTCMQYGMSMRTYLVVPLSSKMFNLHTTWMECHRLCHGKCSISLWKNVQFQFTCMQ